MTNERPCKRCGMPLVFIEGPNGKPIPFQRVRTVYVEDPPTGKILKVRAVTGENADPVKLPGMDDVDGGDRAIVSPRLLISHFETCPYARDFSRGRRGR